MIRLRRQRRQPIDQSKTRHHLLLKRVGRPELRDRTVRRPARLKRSDARIGRHHVPTPLAVVTTTDFDWYVEMPDPRLRVRNLARMLDRGHLLLPTHAVLERSEAEARKKPYRAILPDFEVRGFDVERHQPSILLPRSKSLLPSVRFVLLALRDVAFVGRDHVTDCFCSDRFGRGERPWVLLCVVGCLGHDAVPQRDEVERSR